MRRRLKRNRALRPIRLPCHRQPSQPQPALFSSEALRQNPRPCPAGDRPWRQLRRPRAHPHPQQRRRFCEHHGRVSTPARGGWPTHSSGRPRTGAPSIPRLHAGWVGSALPEAGVERSGTTDLPSAMPPAPSPDEAPTRSPPASRTGIRVSLIHPVLLGTRPALGREWPKSENALPKT